MLPETLVVPLDGSELAERALFVAHAYARQRGGRMLLMSTRTDRGTMPVQRYLAELAAKVDDVDVEARVVTDQSAPDAIAFLVAEAPGRMVCMTTHGRGRLRWALLGSVAEEVLAASSASALLLGRHCRTEWPNNFRKLVVCIDGSSTLPAVEPEATEWAHALGLEVHVATVIHPLDTTPRDPVVEAVAGRIEAHGLHVEQHVIRSSYTAGALADLADGVDADLVAMSSHTRSGTSRIALGSVTMGVVGLVHCPVLVSRVI
jgi:nucleotide-binding universal stress UspA family protein